MLIPQTLDMSVVARYAHGPLLAPQPVLSIRARSEGPSRLPAPRVDREVGLLYGIPSEGQPDRVGRSTGLHGGPLGSCRRIAAALRQLREDSGEYLNEVAADLMVSTSKLSRLEDVCRRAQ